MCVPDVRCGRGVLTGYADVIDSSGVRGPELQGFAVRTQRLLGLVPVRQARPKAVPQEEVLYVCP